MMMIRVTVVGMLMWVVVVVSWGMRMWVRVSMVLAAVISRSRVIAALFRTA
ncbi:MAG TPA: hypothetical protein VFG28_12410 [Syntrophales bacterium]|nr:hypothetical protein [Syntrophales bacterium]